MMEALVIVTGLILLGILVGTLVVVGAYVLTGDYQ